MSILSGRETTEIYITKKGKLFELKQESGTQLTVPINMILQESGIVGEPYVEMHLLYQAEGTKYVISDRTLIDRYRNNIQELAKQFETTSSEESRKLKECYEDILEKLKDAETIEVRKVGVRTNITPSWIR